MEQKYLLLECQSNPKRNIFSFYIYAQIEQWLKANITVHWIALENYSIHQQKVIKAFNRYCFTILTKLQYINLIGQKRCRCPNHWKSKSLINQHRFYRYTTFHFILQSVLFYNQLMSTKRQISSLCKVSSLYEKNTRIFGGNRRR